MATGQQPYNIGDSEVVEKWEREVHVEAAMRSPFLSSRYGFVGESNTSMVQKKKKVWEGEGTRATTTLVRKFQGDPVFGNEELRGREQNIRTATFRWEINQVRGAAQLNGRVNRRRVSWDVWKESITGVGTWFAEVTGSAFMLHGAGVKYDVSNAKEWYFKGNRLANTFANTPRAPDTNHIMRIGHDSDTDDSGVAADPGAIIDLDVITEMKARAKNQYVAIRPATIHGQELYVLFGHSYAFRLIKKQTKWMSVMKAALNERTVDDHPFWTGAFGVWDEVLLVETDFVPPGLSSTNTRVNDARRCVFAGAQSFVFGVAKEFDNDNLYLMDEESWDYANNKGVAATTLGGIACPYYDIQEQGTTDDFGKMVVVAYAPQLITSA